MRLSVLVFGIVAGTWIRLAHADVSGDDYVGVWEGTVGNSKVAICFRPSTFSHSSYYYLRHRVEIPLLNSDTTRLNWTEVSPLYPNATWKLARAAGGRLVGEWSDGSDAHKLPVRLALQRTKIDENGNCWDLGAKGPVKDGSNPAAQRIVKVKEAFGQKQYVSLSVFDADIAGIELPGNRPGDIASNNVLAQHFRDQVATYLGCRNVDDSVRGEYMASMSIAFWNDHWLSVEESSSGNCGGPYPFVNHGHVTIDLDRGIEVDPWSWFKGGRTAAGPKDANGNEEPTALQKLILPQTQSTKEADSGDEDCRQAVLKNHDYELSLTENGIQFATSFPHVIQACDELFVVPYAKLAPFLNASGKEAIAKIAGK